MMMNKSSAFKLSFIVLFGVLSGCKTSFVTYQDKDGRVGDFCAKGKACVNKMLIMSQSSKALLKRINEKKHLNLRRDPGWCGPVSTAMVLDSLKRNYQSGTNISSELLKLPENIYDKSIYAGERVKTNFKKGGTYSKNIKSLYDRIYKYSSAVNRKAKFELKYDKYKSQSDLEREIRKHKMIGSFSVGRYKERYFKYPRPYCKKWRCGIKWKKFNWYVRQSGHILAFNGVDKGVNIYDPWGRIYTVKLKKNKNRSIHLYSTNVGSQISEGIRETLKLIGSGKKTRTEFIYKSGSKSGFAGKSAGKGKKLLVDHILGIAMK